jgi:flagellar basal-body rod protein FlgB
MKAGGPQTDLLFRLMGATSLRAKVIAGNVANVNTPGFLRKEVRFEELLEKAAARGEPLSGIEPQVLEDLATETRSDGNNVTLETELNAMRENRLMYETYSTIVQMHFELLRTGIKDGN